MRVIRASEIGEYLYCRRAWWLKHLHNVASANTRELAAGTAAHQRHGRGVWLAVWLQRAALALLALAVMGGLLFWLLR